MQQKAKGKNKIMNIFILSENPQEAAIAQCDSHVVKMAVESTQLLCNCFPENSFPLQYKRTHYNHPCAVWARESLGNYVWLVDHALALCSEYEHRYGKKHKCLNVLENLPSFFAADCPSIAQTPFALAMPSSFIHLNTKGDIDPITSYRIYYAAKSKSMKRFTYTNRTEPEWLSLY